MPKVTIKIASKDTPLVDHISGEITGSSLTGHMWLSLDQGRFCASGRLKFIAIQ